VTSKSPFKSSVKNIPSDGEEVTHCGYLSTRRDVNKNLSFTMLTTPSLKSCIQLVSNSNEGESGADAHVLLRSLKEWTPVFVRGKLKSRTAAKSNKHLGMTLVADKEIALEHIVPLNRLSDDIIIKSDTMFGPEQRHLQLRTDRELRQSVMFRANAVRIARNYLGSQQWTDIETPVLFKSTPEGAREFLVPTRQKGLAYALPQSPQQYKQILMASGITKYFQFAKCFRDEDLRADRQPEFTQLDMERSFATEGDIMAEIEALVKNLWSALLDIQLPGKLPQMTYHEAMASYGSDKPDLRFGAKVC
jgi:aspartyl-tRNA synthetase